MYNRARRKSLLDGKLSIPVLDLIIIIAYLIGILAVGILSVRRLKLTSQAYFLAGRSLPWGMVGAALFASNISTIHLVGLAASGYNEGLVWGNFEWMATFTLILLGLVFAPFYFKSRISTLPEFLEKRYGPAARMFLAFMAILAALFIHIGMSLYAGAAVFRQFFGIKVITSIVIISVITAIYTILGGLKAVVVTETIQTGILILGAVLVTVFAILALPDQGIHNLAQLKAAVKPDQLSMLQSHSPAGPDLVCRLPRLSDPRHLVLVLRPDDRPAGSGRQVPTRCPTRPAFCRRAENPAGFYHGLPGCARLCPFPGDDRGRAATRRFPS